ncbi:hypothetical protein E4U21_002885 [Claviceps maximensis]|nr:hypothetical protein E4U21_002885 [Claviceps maximensis]
MALQRLLKFPRADKDSSFVLVHVAPNGSKPLDLKLVGTEGAAPYTCSLRHDRVSSLRVKNCPAAETEWHNILISILQQDLLPDIQATATVQSESLLTLTIRKQVQGITQRLGAISLHYEINETIELFDWCAISVDAVTQSKESATESVTKLNGIQATVEDLKLQLDELIQAKKEDELALLQKFKNLLNEKKVKIRQQQALIAQLSLGPVNEMRAPPEAPKSPDELLPAKLPKKRVVRKRKAKTVELEDSDNDLSTTIKSGPAHSDADSTTEVTASIPSDDDDDDDDDNDNDEHEHDDGEHENEDNEDKDDKGSQGSGQIASKPEVPRKAAAEPPPPRTLPFQQRKPLATAKNTDDTDSDDEL